MSTTRGVEARERRRRKRNKKKRETTRHFGPAFQFGGWKRGGKGKAVVFLFLRPLCPPHWIVWIFQPRFNFSPAFSRAAFQTLSASARIKRSRGGFQRGHTRQTHYFCTPRFVFWYHGRGWVVVARKREPRYVFFPLAFSARFLSLSFFFFSFSFFEIGEN